MAFDKRQPVELTNPFVRGLLQGAGLFDSGVLVNKRVMRMVDGNAYDAMVFSQILYWFRLNDENKTRAKYSRDGFLWVVNTAEQWQEQLNFNSKRTINKCFTRLEDNGWIIKMIARSPFHDGKTAYHIRPNWPRIEAWLTEQDKFGNDTTVHSRNDTTVHSKGMTQQCNPYSKNTSKSTTENTTKNTSFSGADAPLPEAEKQTPDFAINDSQHTDNQSKANGESQIAPTETQTQTPPPVPLTPSPHDFKPVQKAVMWAWQNQSYSYAGKLTKMLLGTTEGQSKYAQHKLDDPASNLEVIGFGIYWRQTYDYPEIAMPTKPETIADHFEIFRGSNDFDAYVDLARQKLGNDPELANNTWPRFLKSNNPAHQVVKPQAESDMPQPDPELRKEIMAELYRHLYDPKLNCSPAQAEKKARGELWWSKPSGEKS